MSHKLEVGQTVYVLPVGENARFMPKENIKLRETIITKVGRKYFELEKYNRSKFDVDNLRQVSNYTADWRVYLSEQDYLDETETEKLSSEIRKKIYYDNQRFTLDQLRRIKAIIDEK